MRGPLNPGNYDPSTSGRMRKLGEELSERILVEATAEENPLVFVLSMASVLYQNLLVSVLRNRYEPGDPAAEAYALKLLRGTGVDICTRWRRANEEKPVSVVYLDGTVEKAGKPINEQHND